MSQNEYLNSQANQEMVPDASLYNWEDIKREQDEVTRKSDALFLEYDRLLQEHEDLNRELDDVHLELEQKDQEQERLREELDGIYGLSPIDQTENVGASRNDNVREDAIWRNIETIDGEISQLNQKRDEMTRRSDALSFERDRLDQEEAVLREEIADLHRKWKACMESDEDTEPITDDEIDTDGVIDCNTDEEDSTDNLDDDLFLALSKRASNLCFICRNLARGRSAHLVNSYHPSLSSLKESVDAGCCLCAEVAESLDEFCTRSDPPRTKQEFWSFKCKVFGEGSRLGLAFHLCRCETDHPADAPCEHNKFLRSMSFYPARKLCLGPEFLDPALKTSSAKSAASLSVARSCTLSHCWGKGVIFRLLKDNLKDLSVSIPIKQLPKVFQDAIHVSFEIGISYLWIDSLCIIQDSKEDWTHEAKRMGDVYLHGEFNISATGYQDGLSGLFCDRNALPRTNFPLYADFVHINKDLKKKIAYRGIYIRVNRDAFFEQVIASPLFERAWVAQERVLAPSIIHYTPDQIWWECNQSVSSEAITGTPYVDGQLLWNRAEDTGRCRIRSLSTQSKREDVYAFWNNFLVSYSHCVMTFNRDRFPAVSGIARILDELIDDDFVAGFWSGDLIRSLLLSRQALRASIQDEQLAPSWSWASSTAGVGQDPDETAMSPPTIIDGVCIIKVLSDIPGFKSDLESASFEKSGVRGLVIKGALRILPHKSDSQPSWMEHASMSYDNKDPCEFRGRDNIPEDQKWRLEEPTHMLLLAKARSNGDRLVMYVYGILLQAVLTEGADTFRRSGQICLLISECETWEACFGPREKDEEAESTFGATVRGLQEITLI